MKREVDKSEWVVEGAHTSLTTSHFPLTSGWHAALSEAWTAYCHGSYPIGAVVVDGTGQVIARGRNRLGEPRGVAGVISGHELAHAEINALLALPHTEPPEVRTWTLLTTVQPCPQCAGALAMSGLRALEYAAPDPWAGSTHILTHDPYVSRKGIRVGQAPEPVQRLALRLALVGFVGEGYHPDGPFLKSFAEYTEDLAHAAGLHQAGTLRALLNRGAGLAEVLGVLA
ncbi:nucleoside deaminase [Deinococcus apachensis]|uniref:nucleoside deaminase n=1 Tax=Deinococcus apachensis TaxID=309886 RepID=UPI00037000D5|nr:nucleoside deaminase [Deinococcus apachensis]